MASKRIPGPICNIHVKTNSSTGILGHSVSQLPGIINEEASSLMDNTHSYCCDGGRCVANINITDNILWKLIPTTADAARFIRQGDMATNPRGTNFNNNSDYIVSRSSIDESVHPSQYGGTPNNPRAYASQTTIQNNIYIKGRNISSINGMKGNNCNPVFHIFNPLRIASYTVNRGVINGNGGTVITISTTKRNNIRFINNAMLGNPMLQVIDINNMTLIRALPALINVVDPLTLSAYSTTNGTIKLQNNQGLFIPDTLATIAATLPGGTLPLAFAGTFPEVIASHVIGLTFGNQAYVGGPGIMAGIYFS